MSKKKWNNPAKEELKRRKIQFDGVPNWVVKHVSELSKEDFDKLGNPPVTSNGAGGWYCNCPDGGNIAHFGWDNSECLRCGGYTY